MNGGAFLELSKYTDILLSWVLIKDEQRRRIQNHPVYKALFNLAQGLFSFGSNLFWDTDCGFGGNGSSAGINTVSINDP